MDQHAQKEEVKSFLLRLAVMALMFWLLFGVVFGVTGMKDNSMMPVMASGDLILYYRLPGKLPDRAVVVFRKEGRQYVGRVVARGGDTVEVRQEALYINGNRVHENGIYYRTPAYEGNVTYPITLGENEVFILCDYREGARDSRAFGPVNKKEIKGRVIAVNRRSEL